MSSLKRRDFIKASAVSLTTAAIPVNIYNYSLESMHQKVAVIKNVSGCPMSLFSKPLQFMSVSNMADALKDIGFDGIDLTIRKNGHVEPENAVTELPEAISEIRKAGLDVYTVVTEIDKPTALNQQIIKTLANLGIQQYRLAFVPIQGQKKLLDVLSDIRNDFQGLEKLNRKYGIKGVYQNHSGLRLGGSVWDIWYVIKDLDPDWFGVQYDPMHACIEGQRSWPVNFELIKDRIASINLKDFYWQKKQDKWALNIVPLSEGMVELEKFLQLAKNAKLKVPVSIHLEYDLGGAEHGFKHINISENEILNFVKKDYITAKALMAQVGLTQ